jgi:hypothetical protein
VSFLSLTTDRDRPSFSATSRAWARTSTPISPSSGAGVLVAAAS